MVHAGHYPSLYASQKVMGGGLAQGVNFELNNLEYGIAQLSLSDSRGSQGKRAPEVLFQPSEFGILDRYSVIKEIYKVQLSPTIVSLASHKETN